MKPWENEAQAAAPSSFVILVLIPQRDLTACVVSLRFFPGFCSAIVATSSEIPSPKGFYEEVRGVEDPTLKHVCLLWNPLTLEWYCRDCGRTSDHQAIHDAQTEIEEYPCIPCGAVSDSH
jgi:hypothetical protein